MLAVSADSEITAELHFLIAFHTYRGLLCFLVIFILKIGDFGLGNFRSNFFIFLFSLDEINFITFDLTNLERSMEEEEEDNSLMRPDVSDNVSSVFQCAVFSDLYMIWCGYPLSGLHLISCSPPFEESANLQVPTMWGRRSL